MVEGTSGKSQGVGHSNGSKVRRVMQAYELGGLGEELERRWLGRGHDRQSLRDLADYFNRQVLEAAMEDSGARPIDGEPENHYRLLADDGVSASARAQAETKLKRMGIDLESLRHDFVSHQAIHTYLTDVRGASLPRDEPSAEEEIQQRQDTIFRLRNRLVAVTEKGLKSLQNAGYLSLGTFDVMVSVTVFCNDCEATFTLADLMRQRSCECTEATD